MVSNNSKVTNEDILTALKTLEYARDEWSYDMGMSQKLNDAHCIIQDMEKELEKEQKLKCEDSGAVRIILSLNDDISDVKKEYFADIIESYDDYLERNDLYKNHLEPQYFVKTFEIVNKHAIAFKIPERFSYKELKNFLGYLESKEIWTESLYFDC